MRITQNDRFGKSYLTAYSRDTRAVMWTTKRDSALEFDQKEAEEVAEWLSEELEINVSVET